MKTTLPVAFGRTVRAYRKARNWSQMEVATRAELHLNALSVIERGLVTPSLATVQALARALGIKTAELITWTEKEQEND